MDVKPFAMDEDKELFVIFRERKNGENIFIWVGIEDDFDPDSIRFDCIDYLIGYFTMLGEPMYAGPDFPQEKVALALDRLKECPEEVLDRGWKRYRRQIEHNTEDEDDAKRWNAREREYLREFAKARKTENGLIIL